MASRRTTCTRSSSTRATKKLNTIKDDIVWWNSGAETQELIGSGEVAMSMIWNGRG